MSMSARKTLNSRAAAATSVVPDEHGAAETLVQLGHFDVDSKRTQSDTKYDPPAKRTRSSTVLQDSNLFNTPLNGQKTNKTSTTENHINGFANSPSGAVESRRASIRSRNILPSIKVLPDSPPSTTTTMTPSPSPIDTLTPTAAPEVTPRRRGRSSAQANHVNGTSEQSQSPQSKRAALRAIAERKQEYERGRLGIKVPRLLHKQLRDLMPAELDWRDYMHVFLTLLHTDAGKVALARAVEQKRS